MRIETLNAQAPASGANVTSFANLSGYGFRLIPRSGPARFPLKVKLDGGLVTIDDDGPIPSRARLLELLPHDAIVSGVGQDAEAWGCHIYDCYEELAAARPGHSARSATVTIYSAQALSAAAPASASDGFAVPDAWTNGTLKLKLLDLVTTGRWVRKWTLADDGATWIPSGQTQASDKANDTTAELAITGGEQVYLQIADGLGALSVDAIAEVPT